jgi:hypothetical protein
MHPTMHPMHPTMCTRHPSMPPTMYTMHPTMCTLPRSRRDDVMRSGEVAELLSCLQIYHNLGRYIHNRPVQCSAVRCSAVQCSAVQCSVVQ